MNIFDFFIVGISAFAIITLIVKMSKVRRLIHSFTVKRVLIIIFLSFALVAPNIRFSYGMVNSLWLSMGFLILTLVTTILEIMD
ncbi:MAG: hypothetical protein FWE60_03060 [Oscillospiraceae bacterium]|nr:hypothetical protein [Oscillospiraceae bacterium]